MSQPLPNIDSLSLDDKVGQLFFIGLPGPTVDSVAEELLGTVRPGGVCLFSRNIKDAAQTRELLESIGSSLTVPPLLSVDQEGGLVDRLRRIVGPMPAAADLRNESDVRTLGRIVARTLRILGFNMDFAPVVDVGGSDRGRFANGLQGRIFGSSANDSADFGAYFLEELNALDCLGCLKHFPGLGAAEVDSHEELPSVGVGPETFETVELEPYRRLFSSMNVDSVMVAHASFPNIGLQEADRDGRLLPASLSFNMVTGLLRRELGYSGVVITDDLEMGAIVRNYGIGDACRMAFAAGIDMLAICAGPDAIRAGHSAIMGSLASGEIQMERLDASVTRILQLKSRIAEQVEFDAARLAELSGEVASLKNSLN